MTANLAPDPERILEAYADATRIVASGQLVRRFQASVTEERERSAARPWAGVSAPLASARLRLRDALEVAFARHVTFALRLQSLALVLLTVLALGALVSGAGAVVVHVVTRPDQGPTPPGMVLAPDASPHVPDPIATPALPIGPTSRLPTPSPTAAPSVTVRVLAQEAPRGTRHRKRRTSPSHRVDAARRPIGAVRRVVLMGEADHRPCPREHYCAS